MRTPDFDDILKATRRLAGHAVRTPLLESALLNEFAGGRVLLKAETLQRTGSFKFRGAYNKISQLNKAEFPGGVVACSSGNHAQGVAEAARLCGLPSLIVMPSDAPPLKVERTRRSGAEIVFYDREKEDRNAIAAALAQARNAALAPPFDDPDIIAGQGAVGLELMLQAQRLDAEIEAVLTPVSGGGLAAGIGLAVKHISPGCAIFCAEPEGFDDYARSLKSGRRERNEKLSGSICDALLVSEPGELTFSINRAQLAGGLTVSDDEVRRAMAFAFRELKLVVEPGGAAALAALLAGHYKVSGGTVAIVLSGGNADPAQFAAIIGGCRAD